LNSSNTTSEYALGVDIGGTNSVYGICDKDGTLKYESSVHTTDFNTAQGLVDFIYDDLRDKHLIDPIVGIGVGAPNGNYYSGTIEFAPNLSWKGIVPLAQLFHDKFGVPSVLTNDANAAAIGEMLYGNARDLANFVTITLGTGLGSGIVINRELLYGHDGFAGEYGHIQVIPDGRKCGCGRHGCLETYVSATGVVRSINELPSDAKASSALNTGAHFTAQDVFELALNGDVFAKEIIEFTERTLGKALADFTCFSSPQAYVLFGGIAQNGAPFAEKVKLYMEEQMLNIYKNKVEIRISSLHDKNAAVLGAASLVWNERKKL
jgi:glucokinase